VNSWFGCTPCSRATSETRAPGRSVSATRRRFASALNRRRPG